MVIYKEMTWRLWNQFFQYAAIKSFKEKYNIKDDIVLDFSKLKNLWSYEEWFCDSLKDFNISDYKHWKLRCSIVQKIIYIYCKIFAYVIFKDNKIKLHNWQLRNQNYINKLWIYFLTDWYYDFWLHKMFRDKIFFWNFESGKYFENIKDELYRCFTPKYDKLESNFELYDIIERYNSICVSVRCWDFFSEEFKNHHLVCTPEYFNEAINKISKMVKDPVFIIFSDDINWCKNNLWLSDQSVYYETENNPVWEKLRLMYSCKHFIISNSTFSRWAQYLSRNEDKIVIAPKRRKNFPYREDWVFDICEEWRLLI